LPLPWNHKSRQEARQQRPWLNDSKKGSRVRRRDEETGLKQERRNAKQIRFISIAKKNTVSAKASFLPAITYTYQASKHVCFLTCS
jgi:hypothetical protein